MSQNGNKIQLDGALQDKRNARFNDIGYKLRIETYGLDDEDPRTRFKPHDIHDNLVCDNFSTIYFSRNF